MNFKKMELKKKQIRTYRDNYMYSEYNCIPELSIYGIQIYYETDDFDIDVYTKLSTLCLIFDVELIIKSYIMDNLKYINYIVSINEYNTP